MSDSVRPQRRQPTRLPRPWDSPGKNTGVGCHFLLQYMKVKSESEVAQSCPTLSDPMDCSLPGSSVHGIFQARVLEWGAIAFSKGLNLVFWIAGRVFTSWTTREAQKLKVKFTKLCPTLETPWNVACQAPLSMGFSSKNTGVGCHFLLQGIFLTQESNPRLLHCRQILYQLSYEGSPRTK